MFALALLIAAFAPCTLCALAPSGTWTVDDDAPADFAEIGQAIAAVAPGDVLRVEPGEYAGFVLNKRLTILGRVGVAPPHVEGLSQVTATTFTLAGLDFDGLAVTGAPGRARIDDCRVGTTGDAAQAYALLLDGCAQVVVSRTQVVGSRDYSQAHSGLGGSGALVQSSNATLVDCDITGAKGQDPVPQGLDGGTGGDALRVSVGSHCVVAGSALEGGPEGWSSAFLGCHDGPSGAGLRLSGSLVVLRGAQDGSDSIAPGWVDGFCTDTLGAAIAATTGMLVTSGVGFDHGNLQLGGAQFVEPATAEPFLHVEGSDAPGGSKQIRLHGPAGTPCLLAVSLAPALAAVAGFDDKLWLDVSGFHLLLPLVTSGQSTPLTLSWTVPASTVGLLGSSIELQPFFPGVPSAITPGKSVAGNVAELIVRF